MEFGVTWEMLVCLGVSFRSFSPWCSLHLLLEFGFGLGSFRWVGLLGWSSAGLMGMVVFTSLVVGSLGGIVFGTCYHNLGHTVGWCFASSSVLSADINRARGPIVPRGDTLL